MSLEGQKMWLAGAVAFDIQLISTEQWQRKHLG